MRPRKPSFHGRSKLEDSVRCGSFRAALSEVQSPFSTPESILLAREPAAELAHPAHPLGRHLPLNGMSSIRRHQTVKGMSTMRHLRVLGYSAVPLTRYRQVTIPVVWFIALRLHLVSAYFTHTHSPSLTSLTLPHFSPLSAFMRARPTLRPKTCLNRDIFGTLMN